MNEEKKPSKKGLYAAIAGTAAVALCCFTSVLVVALTVLGLSAFTPYLDWVLFPILGFMILITVVSYRRWKKRSAQQAPGSGAPQ